MKKPLHFKLMLKPKVNPSSALTSTKNIEDLEREKIKRFLNTFKCPLCNCLLDGQISSPAIVLKCCCAPDHYQVNLDSTDPNNIKIMWDYLILVDIKSKREYDIYRNWLLPSVNRITIWELNGDSARKGKPKTCEVSLLNVNYSNLDRDKLHNLVKTILIFS